MEPLQVLSLLIRRNNGNEGVLHILHFFRTVASPSDAVLCHVLGNLCASVCVCVYVCMWSNKKYKNVSS